LRSTPMPSMPISTMSPYFTIVIPLCVNADDRVWANQTAGWVPMRACHCHIK
jgi:hypothetical protein